MDIASPIVLGEPDSEKQGDFGIVVNANSLGVSKKLLRFATENNYHNVIQLFTAIDCFPSSVADALGWTNDEVATATKLMRTQLRGHLPDYLIDPTNRPARSTGAI